MKKLTLLFAVTLFSGGVFAQIAPDKYFVKFTDKEGTPYSVNNPSEFLSERAIERRQMQGIAVDESDLPVNPEYVSDVEAVGATILNRTKWLNGVTIYTADTSVVEVIAQLPFVEYVTTNFSPKSSGTEPDFVKPFFLHEDYSQEAVPLNSNLKNTSAFDYGPSFNQISMLNGDQMHEQGFRGQGKVIAVLDAGFLNANVHEAFDSLWSNGQILGTHDFVAGGPVTFDQHPHGTMVLSCMGANVPGELIGTAPKASYWLLRSEDGATEYLIEEYNWVSAAEFADSVGVDIINSSLGYTEFYDPSQNHTYADMDGNTTVVTIGADYAAKKGIFVSNSLGNEGGNSWYYLSAPSDGDSVMGVGAVDADGNYVGFSSHGPSYDGRVKPDVATQGSGVYVADPYWEYTYSGGTSFSSPILAGMAACLWQANPEHANVQVMEAIRQSASQYTSPDEELGYGIPDFMLANNILTVVEEKQPADQDHVIYPNPFNGDFYIRVNGSGSYMSAVTVSDLTGRVLWGTETPALVNVLKVSGLDGIPPGVYIVRIESGGFASSRKLIKK